MSNDSCFNVVLYYAYVTQVHVTLETSISTGPGINLERSCVRVFKRSKFSGLTDGF